MEPLNITTAMKDGRITPYLRRSAFALALTAAASGAVKAEALKADFNGDGFEDLVVGVPYDTPGGSVTVFYSDADGLSTTPLQTFSQDSPGAGDSPPIAGEAESGDLFGSALAVGDFNGDGRSDLAVGVPGEDLPGVGADRKGTDAGAIHIIYGGGFALDSRGNQILTLSNVNRYRNLNKPGSFFGSRLATGDLNGNGISDLIVGVPSWDDPDAGKNVGLVAVFFGSTRGFIDQNATFYTQNQTRVPGDMAPGNRFGDALAIADFNRDGIDDMAIGIPGDNLGTKVNAGSVTIIYRKVYGLEQPEVLQDQFVATGDQFGKTLVAGDFNGDGNSDLAIGHPLEDASARNSGAVTVLFGNGSSPGFVARRQYWPADVYNLPGRPEDGDFFGRTLAAADFDGNGIDDLAIGSPNESQERSYPFSDRRDVGLVTVLYGTIRGLTVTERSNWHQDRPRVATRRRSLEYFGNALSVGDFNHDRIADLVVGVPGQTQRDYDQSWGDDHGEGMVHIFYGTSAGLSSDPALGPETFSQRSGTYFGKSLPGSPHKSFREFNN